MKLSKREITLIAILILILVIVVPFLVFIQPRLSILVMNQETLIVMKKQKEELELKIQKIDENLIQIENLQKEAGELYELMEQTKSYDISLMLSELLTKHNLMPVSLFISPYQQAPIPENPEDTAESENTEEADTAMAQQDMALIRTADLFFTGERANVNSFVDELTNMNKSVLIKSFTISQGEEINYEIKIDFYEFSEPQVQTQDQE